MIRGPWRAHLEPKKKKAASYKPQAASAMKRTQLKSIYKNRKEYMHFKLISLIKKVLLLKNEDEIELIHWAVMDAIERQNVKKGS